MTGANAWRRQRRCYVPCVILRVLFLRVREKHPKSFLQTSRYNTHTIIYNNDNITRVDEIQFLFWKGWQFLFSYVWNESVDRLARIRSPKTPCVRRNAREIENAFLTRRYFELFYDSIPANTSRSRQMHNTTSDDSQNVNKKKKKSCLINSTYL